MTIDSQPGPIRPSGLVLPELIFGMVRAIGTNLKPVQNAIVRNLKLAGVLPRSIRLSVEIGKQPLVKDIAEPYGNAYYRYDHYMTAGDALRSFADTPEAAAILAMSVMQRHRASLERQARNRGFRGVAFILNSLMHPAEIRLLRDVYGPRLFVISAYAHEGDRRNELEEDLTEASLDMDQPVSDLVDDLMERDRGRGYPTGTLLATTLEPERHLPLSIEKTFELGDVFIDTTPAKRVINEDISRIISLIFGDPRLSPTRDEMGMAYAYSARLRSADLSRQVGAAICDGDGQVQSTGTNEVPKFGGGQYWVGAAEVHRDVEEGFDSGERVRRNVFSDLIARLIEDPRWLEAALGEGGGLSDAFRARLSQIAERCRQERELLDREDDLAADDVEGTERRGPMTAAVEAALSSRTIAASRFFDVIEYGRAVHAEMAAICSAALRGVPIRGSVIYSTTFPCHECARHIVACGLTRVVYIEPYPKSRVAQLYRDSVAIAHRERLVSTRLVFQPFMGVSPRRHSDLFSWGPKKVHDVDPRTATKHLGELAEWTLESAPLRHTLQAGRDEEALAVQQEAVERYESQLRDRFQASMGEASARYGRAIKEYLHEHRPAVDSTET